MFREETDGHPNMFVHRGIEMIFCFHVLNRLVEQQRDRRIPELVTHLEDGCPEDTVSSKVYRQDGVDHGN